MSASAFVYEADTSNDRIQKFSRTGLFVKEWGSSGTAEMEFSAANGIAVDSSGDVYVAEFNNHRVQKFDSIGSFIRMWGWGVATGAGRFEVCTSTCQAGAATSGDGGFTWPHGVAVDVRGYIHVVDQVNTRVQMFKTDGSFVMSWGKAGPSDGQFIQPVAIAIGPFDDIYVSDTVHHNIQRFRAHPLWYFEAAPVPEWSLRPISPPPS